MLSVDANILIWGIQGNAAEGREAHDSTRGAVFEPNPPSAAR
jgi:hypothetical protein